MDAEIEAIARRHGWPEGAVAELQAVFDRFVSSRDQASVLTTLGPSMHPVALADEDAPAEAPPVEGPADRYEDLGPLGVGGMGEVRRVRDRDLNRTMAMKIIKAPMMEHRSALARFIEEAQCSAQLQHPGIVPVHELGRLPDGRFYFTMREVRGRTLSEVIAEVHAASGERWETSPSGWTFRRLVDAFHRVCEAVAYAHARGVVHRDLKPDNVMLGAHGEVLVLDWGLAKVLGRRDLAAEAGGLDPVVTDRSQDDAQATRMGQVAGTPAYMPPEQACGQIDAIDARSDIYSLGAVLYQLLSGRPPFTGSSARAVLAQVLAGPPDPLGSAPDSGDTFGLWLTEEAEASPGAAGLPLPVELVAACERAMARESADRFAGAEALALEVRAWLDGVRRREQALAVVTQAEGRGPEAAALRARAGALRVEAEGLLAEIEPWRPEEDKAPGWAKEDEAAALERQAELAMLEQEQLLQASLTHAPDLPEAHAALAARYRAEHEAAEAERRDATRAELRLRTHAAALPEDHPDRPPLVTYLKGDGALTLVTDPPGAEVLLRRYEVQNRRLVPVFQRSLGLTPLVEAPLPMGSYLCILRHPERAETRYPVFIGRGEHWDGVRPGGTRPHSVRLLRPDDLGPHDCYLPAGWFQAGGDPDAQSSMPRCRLWCDELVVRCFPVTNHEYIAFLDDLVAQGRQEEALRHAPRERAGSVDEQGALIYGFEGGRFQLRPDADGDIWLSAYPVMMVDWHGAMAYAAWSAARSGRPWRLPGELEREKAARGVDGRRFPWGDHLDPSWCCMIDSHRSRCLPAEVDRFPIDSSVYGVRGLGGNMRDWCADPWEDGLQAARRFLASRVVGAAAGGDVHPPDGGRVIRGGAWLSPAPWSRSAFRSWDRPGIRGSYLGFRLARSLPRDP